MFKTILSLSMLVSSTVAFASGPAPTREEVAAALATLKAAGVTTQDNDRVSRVLLKTGLGLGAGGVISIFAGANVYVSATKAVGVFGEEITKPMVAQIGSTLVKGGAIAVTSGMVMVIGGAAMEVLRASPAEAADLDVSILSSPESFQRFLDLPIESSA